MRANYDDEMPLVTIVMRTYERPVLLARAVASVCGQTLSNWELIIVNNGGTREPIDHIVRLAKTSYPTSNISVLHLSERVGMEEASNSGLAQSSSEFFAIHDDDDSWKPEFLELAVQHMEKNPHASAIVTGVVRIHETFINSRVWPVRNEKFYLTQERLTFEGMIGNNTFPPIAALFRRSLLQHVGMFDASLPVLGDWEFNLRALENGPFVFVPERLANYHTRTTASDVAAGNSITVGQTLHQQVKTQLQQRWDSEPGRDGVSKGECSRRAAAELDAEDARRTEAERAAQTSGGMTAKVARVLRTAKRPRAAGRAVVRRVRARVGR